MTREPRQLAQVYAQSVFELAKEQHLVDDVKRDLTLLSGLIEQHGDFIRLLGSPYLAAEQKELFLRRVLSGGVGELTMRFLVVAIKHNRAGVLPAVIARCDELWDDYYGLCPVTVTVCRRLDDAEVDAVRESIAAAINKKVKLAVAVDPAIMGGMEIRCGAMVIDNTVRNRLRLAVKSVMGQVRAGR
jgi:F-type H+-transporting ATPase subunit delta